MRWKLWRVPLAACVTPWLSMACGTSSDHAPGPAPSSSTPAPPVEPRPVAFEKLTLHRQFLCEGAGYGDLDRDGDTDVIAGPDWYAGPDFREKRALWTPAAPFDPRGYSDCFFQFANDVDGDGWLDVVLVGFPGAAGYWLENPRGQDVPWPRHEIAAVIDAEAPAFTDLTGDGRPELVFAQNGALGWAAPESSDPRAPWPFRRLSEARGYGAFMHGLGVGDVDGDGRADVLEASGFFLQPAALDGDPIWVRRDQAFGMGGAQMITSDVDADGDADVITTLAAHGYGLAWYEQVAPLTFVEHIIVPGSEPGPDAEVVMHEPHALAVADVDGDGSKDIVTGERFWGHVPGGDPDFAAPARLYWFRNERSSEGRHFVPALIDADSGVGTELKVADLDGDLRPDLLLSNKKGAFVFLQR